MQEHKTHEPRTHTSKNAMDFLINILTLNQGRYIVSDIANLYNIQCKESFYCDSWSRFRTWTMRPEYITTIPSLRIVLFDAFETRYELAQRAMHLHPQSPENYTESRAAETWRLSANILRHALAISNYGRNNGHDPNIHGYDYQHYTSKLAECLEIASYISASMHTHTTTDLVEWVNYYANTLNTMCRIHLCYDQWTEQMHAAQTGMNMAPVPPQSTPPVHRGIHYNQSGKRRPQVPVFSTVTEKKRVKR